MTGTWPKYCGRPGIFRATQNHIAILGGLSEWNKVNERRTAVQDAFSSSEVVTYKVATILVITRASTKRISEYCKRLLELLDFKRSSCERYKG